MKFPIVGASDEDIGTADTYNFVGSPSGVDWSTTENQRRILLTEDIVITDLTVTIQTAPGVGKTRTFTVRKNGVDTAVTVTISDANTTATFSGSVTFAAGDLINMKASSTGTPGAPNNIHWHMFWHTTGQKALLVGGTSTSPSASAINYNNPFGSGAAWNNSVGALDVPVAAAGTITKLAVVTDVAPGASKSYAVSLRINGTTDVLTATVSGLNTSATATGSQALALGNDITLKSSPSGTPAAVVMGWCVTFEPTTNGETFVGYGTNVALSTSATRFQQPIGSGVGYSATESTAQVRLPGCSVKNLYVRLSAAPGVAASRTITWRDNGASSALAVTIADPATTGSDTSNTIAHTANQTAGFQLAVSAVPNPAACHAHMSVALVTVQPVVVSPGTIASTAAVYAPTLVPGSITVSPGTITSTALARTPTITHGPITVTPATIASTAVVYAPTIALGNRFFEPPYADTLPPTVPGIPGNDPIAHRLLRHFKNRAHGQTVLKIDGAYVTLEHPSQAQLDSATEVYLGGHRYAISHTTAAALTAAGYGGGIT